MTKEEKIVLLRELYLQDIAHIQAKPVYSEYENFVPGEGSPDAPLLFVGEAPGQVESIKKRPFVGKSGMLLRTILKELFAPGQYFITNVVKWRPPHNRTPTPEEILFGLNTYLKKEVEIIKPQLICTLGASALRALAPYAPNISTSRGKVISFNDIPLLPTIHPAYAIYQPEQKAYLEKDLQAAKAYLASLPQKQS